MATDQPHTPQSSARATAHDWRARVGGHKKAWIQLGVALALIAWAGTWIYHRYTHLHIDDARRWLRGN